MDSSIFRYIIRYTLRDQVCILLLTVLTFPIVYGTLEVPKRIINEALGHYSEPVVLFGIHLAQLEYLLTLCFTFLGLVLINGGLKYVLNIYRGVVGERTLKQLRFQLFSRLLRFPPKQFQRVSQGEIIPIITAETEPLGGFIGEAYALPLFQGGLLLTYLFFIFNQDPFLGLAATALYPFQLYIIPKLQRKVNELGRKRVLAARQLGDRIGESIGGILEIQGYATGGFEQRQILGRLETIFRIRLQIFKRKYFIKFLNNFLAKITPFFFYAFGGYYVIQGELSLGALVASIAAYQDLESPWKELLKYYQTKEDVRIKYEQIVEQFNPSGLASETLEQISPITTIPANSIFNIENVPLISSAGPSQTATFSVAINEHVAIYGNNESGALEMGQLLGRIHEPVSGRMTLAGNDLKSINRGSLAQAIIYVGQAHIFTGKIRDNLFYGLQRQELLPSEVMTLDVPATTDACGNITHSASQKAMVLELLRELELDQNIYALGLETIIPQDPCSESQNDQPLSAKIIAIRNALRERLQQKGHEHLITFYQQDTYNPHLSVSANLMFGTTEEPALIEERMAEHPLVIQALHESQSYAPLVEIGAQLNSFMLELFSDVKKDDEILTGFSFIHPDELPEYQQLQRNLDKKSAQMLAKSEQIMLLHLSLQLTVAKHRLGLIDETIQKKIVNARHILAQLCEKEQLQVTFFSDDEYNWQQSILDNILFGVINQSQAQAQEKVRCIIDEMVNEADIYNDILSHGLAFDVGSSGKKLKPDSRQMTALLRALVANPQLLIVNHATQLLAPDRELKLLKALKRIRGERGLIWISARPEHGQYFDRTITLDKGIVVDDNNALSDVNSVNDDKDPPRPATHPPKN